MRRSPFVVAGLRANSRGSTCANRATSAAKRLAWSSGIPLRAMKWGDAFRSSQRIQLRPHCSRNAVADRDEPRRSCSPGVNRSATSSGARVPTVVGSTSAARKAHAVGISEARIKSIAECTAAPRTVPGGRAHACPAATRGFNAAAERRECARSARSGRTAWCRSPCRTRRARTRLHGLGRRARG